MASLPVSRGRANLDAALRCMEAGELALARLRFAEALRDWRYMDLGGDVPEITSFTLEIACVGASLRDSAAKAEPTSGE